MSKWSEYNEQFSRLVKWDQVANDILGLELTSEPNDHGWAKCRSIDGDDANPSASFNLETGYYKDFRDGMPACSACDLMVQIGKSEDYGDSRKKIGEKFGIKWPGIDSTDAAAGVKWQVWNDNLAKQYCSAKPPITIAGLKRAGARCCMRFGIACFALPVFGNSIHNIIGWMFFPRNGQPFQHEKAKGAKSICKIDDRQIPSFVTGPEILFSIMEEATAPEFYWCEGAPDMLAGLSVHLKSLFVTNPYGCAENVSDTQKQIILYSRKNVIVIGDADVPGVRGAMSKARALPDRIKVVIPPYEIDQKHGKDYRDWKIQTWSDGSENPVTGLVPVPETFQKESEEVVLATEQEEEKERQQKEAISIGQTNEKLLDRLGVQVCGADVFGGISIFCETTNRSKYIKNIALMKYPNWVQLLGYKFSLNVAESIKDWEARIQSGDKNIITYSRFMNAVADMASRRTVDKNVGAGVWGVHDDDRVFTGDLILVKNGVAIRYDSSTSALHRLNPPVYKGISCDVSTSYNWFKEEVLANYIVAAKSKEWRYETYSEMYKLLRRWNWENENMAQLVVGLLMGTAIQSVLKIRPTVTLTAESGSGKTFLLGAITNMFGGLAQHSAKSTAAGILQNMKNHSRPLLIDEFENNKEQQKLFGVFRLALHKQEMLLGTSDQHGRSYSVCHIPWMSGIYALSTQQADLNRQINIQMLPVKREVLKTPMPADKIVEDLGARMLAGVIVTAKQILQNIDTLMATDIGFDIAIRYRESYAVPFGCLGAFIGLAEDEMIAAYKDYLNTWVLPQIFMADTQNDHEELLHTIMSTEVRLPYSAPKETATVAEILFDPSFAAHRDICRTKGVAYVVSKVSSVNKVAFAPKLLVKRGSGLLSNTDWVETPGVGQVLRRLGGSLGARVERQCISGVNTYCVSIDCKKLSNWIKRTSNITPRQEVAQTGGDPQPKKDD